MYSHIHTHPPSSSSAAHMDWSFYLYLLKEVAQEEEVSIECGIRIKIECVNNLQSIDRQK